MSVKKAQETPRTEYPTGTNGGSYLDTAMMADGKPVNIDKSVPAPTPATEVVQDAATDAALDIIRMKTVSFMTSAAKVGALLGNADPTQLDALIKYSEMLGFSFQIRDDILDIVATQNGTGKTVLSDLRGSRSNFVLTHAIENSSSKQKDEFVQKLDEGDTEFALERIREHKSVERSTEIAKQYMLAAKDAIRGIEFVNEELLLLLADFAMKRLY